MFGDDDPEDAWDAGDPVDVKVAILERWVPSIVLERMTPHNHPRVVARVLGALQSINQLALEVDAQEPDAARRLQLLELLGHLRDRVLEAQAEEGP